MNDCSTCSDPTVCCSQYIFITKTELRKLKKFGNPIVMKWPHGYLMNPNHEVCVFLKSGKCSVYAKRPANCKKFNCQSGFVMLETMVRDKTNPISSAMEVKVEKIKTSLLSTN